MKFFRSILLATATAALAAVGLIQPAFGSVENGSCWTYKDSERAFARRVNTARADVGQNKLRLDPELSRVARRHAVEMLEVGRPYHTPDQTLARRVTNWRVLSENVGEGNKVGETFRAFMEDAAHRYNIEREGFVYVGVGVVRNDAGRMWVALVFESRSDPGTTLRMPSC